MMDFILPIIHEIEDNECIALRDNEGSYFASCIDSVENAEFIVKAVNNHYRLENENRELLEVIKGVEMMLSFGMGTGLTPPQIEVIKQLIDDYAGEAIKQAEEL